MYEVGLITLLLLLWYFEVIQRLKQFLTIIRFSRTIKGPSTLEFIKNANSSKILQFLVECSQKYGSKFGVWIGKDLILFITSPEDAKVILSSQELIYKSRNHEIFKPWLGEGLLISGGEKWQRARKFLTPAFHFNILKQFYGAMNECGEILIRKLGKVANNDPVDIYPFITLFALDIICETALGIKKNAQENSESEYVKAVQGICQLLQHRAFNFFLRNDFIFKFSSLNRTQETLLQILHKETNQVIDNRRTALKSIDLKTTDEALQTADSGLNSKKRLAFLDMLLLGQLEGKGITDLQIREEVDTFMFEGHDTTSSALSFAIYLLSIHQDIQQIAYFEAKEFEGREFEPMKYLEAVIKETLRLYPSVPMFSRTLRQDFAIGDTIIPKGVSFSILAFALQRDSNEFPDPEAFQPNRFLGQDVQNHPFSHIAFSAGPRNCIGQKFAMLELKTTLSKLLRAFEFKSAGEPLRLVPELILKSSVGMHVRINKRVAD